MTWFKRIAFFAMVNLGIILMLSLVINLLGIQPYLSSTGLNYESLFLFCLVWGTGGAFISLWISKFMAKQFMGVKIVDAHGPYRELVQMVHSCARKAGLPEMPEVGVYESPVINAFATGPSKSNSLVAVSTGLLQKMRVDELEGVLGHEVAHIANGDMVTMTLLQGIMNAFVMFFARIVAFAIDSSMRSSDDERGGGLGYFGYVITVFLFEMVFGLVGQVVTSYFSRWREYHADAGSARFVGKTKMIAALQALKADSRLMEESTQNNQMAAFQISSKGSFLALFSTHPSLDDRIAKLRTL